MEDNWKVDFEGLLLNELSKRAKPIFEKAAAIYSDEVEAKKSACTSSEFRAFLESEIKRIKRTPEWDRFYKMIPQHKTIKNVARSEIRQRITDLQTPPTDISDLVAAIEQSPNYIAIMEGRKMQRQINVLQNSNPFKEMKKLDLFAQCLESAIEDEANTLLGMTPAKIELTQRIASMIEAQAGQKVNEYSDFVDMRFGRLSRETERMNYLETQRLIYRDSRKIIDFDKELYHVERDLEQREKIARAVGMAIKPTHELMNLWLKCERQPAKFIQSQPFLKKMLEGRIEDLKFQFLEEEIVERKARIEANPGEEMPSGIVTNTLVFESLFTDDEAMERALSAAKQVGIINDAGIWALEQRGSRGIKVVLDYWCAISHDDFGLTCIQPKSDDKFKTYVLPCKAICTKFETKTMIADSTVYDHIPKSRGKFYAATMRALTGK